jgi:hypothetical protein
LFWQTKTTGISRFAAKFAASWKSPSLVAPSPKKVQAICFSPRYLAAHARPVACSICVPIGTAIGVAKCSRGIALPRSSPIQCRRIDSIGTPRQNRPQFSR